MTNKKIISFLSLLLIFTISLGVVCAENATDENPTTDIKIFDDLQSQISSASENDTIQISGTYKSIGNDIVINRPLLLKVLRRLPLMQGSIQVFLA